LEEGNTNQEDEKLQAYSPHLCVPHWAQNTLRFAMLLGGLASPAAPANLCKSGMMIPSDQCIIRFQGLNHVETTKFTKYF